MKKLRLVLVMAVLLIGIGARAEWRPVWHSMDEPVKVKVRSVDFFVFPNGQFDFNAHQNPYADYGVRVERDRYGKIRRVGNVYLNYNRAGQVTRIGNVFIQYHRGVMRKIGRMHLRYTGGGYVISRYRHSYGYYNTAPAYSYSSTYYGPANTYSYGSACGNTNGNTYGSTSYNDDYYESNEPFENEDDYYYRKPAKGKKIKVKGRRKSKNRR